MSQSSEPILVAEGLTRSFGGVTAVNNVDLVVHPGELVGIMGPNGAGKSTFFSLVAGARKPSSGKLHVCGKDFTKISLGEAARYGVGLAHQIPKPFRKLTVRQNVDIASYVLPRSRRKAAVDYALEVSGLTDRQDKLAGELGLLELKRLEIARVLALEPKLVLLDEVAAGLNESDLDELIDLVRKVHATGKTVILVEHVQEVIHKLAQRVVVLEWGSKLTEGTPEAVSKDPRVIEIYLGSSENESALKREKQAPGSEQRLAVSGLSAGYGPIKVLDNVSFDVAQGEILTVLGANGAGKTTLAKTLEGMVKARSGSVVFKGQTVTDVPTYARQRLGLALVPEGRRLFGELTVKENLRLGLKSERGFKATHKDQSPLDKVYELFPKLIELNDRPAGQLSGGEQQMVAVGRALAGEPDVIIFDELSLGLAPIVVDRLLEAVVKIANWGMSVVLIEQNIHKAMAVADKILVLKRGEVVFSGKPSDFSEEELQRAYLGAD
jgi:branched-chain amino acid transport system ATP-binding protein